MSGSGFLARSRLIAAFAAVYLIWGSTFLALALGLQSIPPLLLMGARSIAAGAMLLAVEQVRRPGFPPGRAWASAAVSGILLFAGCHGTLAYAQQYVPSGLAAVMLATVPFWIVLLGVFAPTDPRAKMLTFAGLLPGLAGVALIAWPQDPRETAPIDPLMLLLLLGSAFFWAAGSLVSRRQQAPIIAVILGWRFLGERPTPHMLVGTTLVVGSVAAVWRLSNRPPPQAR